MTMEDKQDINRTRRAFDRVVPISMMTLNDCNAPVSEISLLFGARSVKRNEDRLALSAEERYPWVHGCTDNARGYPFKEY